MLSNEWVVGSLGILGFPVSRIGVRFPFLESSPLVTVRTNKNIRWYHGSIFWCKRTCVESNATGLRMIMMTLTLGDLFANWCHYWTSSTATSGASELCGNVPAGRPQWRRWNVDVTRRHPKRIQKVLSFGETCFGGRISSWWTSLILPKHTTIQYNTIQNWIWLILYIVHGLWWYVRKW